jgi:hypothetical protein
MLGLFKRKTFIDDSYFGRMAFTQPAGFWEGHIPFPNREGLLEVLVSAPLSGPTDKHRDLVRNLLSSPQFFESARQTIAPNCDADWDLVVLDVQETDQSLRVELTFESRSGDPEVVALLGSTTDPRWERVLADGQA